MKQGGIMPGSPSARPTRAVWGGSPSLILLILTVISPDDKELAGVACQDLDCKPDSCLYDAGQGASHGEQAFSAFFFFFFQRFFFYLSVLFSNG